MDQIYYTGIGSRTAPIEILTICEQLGEYLAKQNWVLRSGGAEGCDKYFEKGCDKESGSKEIYLPWKNFNNNKSDLYYIPLQAYNTVKTFHPRPNTLKNGAIKLIARNSQQILGQLLTIPSNIIIFYAPTDNKDNVIGGTGQAIRMAKTYNIPTINLFKMCELNLSDLISKIKESVTI